MATGEIVCSCLNSAACRGPNPGRSRSALSLQFSWSRHGARFSTRSMIAHTSLTHGTLRSRAFQTNPTRPPTRTARARAAIARSSSNQWNACAIVTASSEPSRNGSCSAVVATIGTLGNTSRKVARMPATGSAAIKYAPAGTSRRVSLPVPAARSTTVAPGAMRKFSTNHATASGGYDGRAAS